jgi:regulator of RNase E activity RraA
MINAVWGGLRSARAKYIGVKAAVVDGRCRDVPESRELGFPASTHHLRDILPANPACHLGICSRYFLLWCWRICTRR